MVMTKVIRILLVDDHQIVRDGLQRMLEQHEDLEVVGQCANSEETLAKAEEFSPNIVLMDIKMPGIDGIELTRRIKRSNSDCSVIMLTLYDQYLTQAMEAGARGYLLKDIKSGDLAQAIRQVHLGKVVTSESIKTKVQHHFDDDNGKKTEEGLKNMVEELQLVLPPPVEANQLMRLAGRAEETLQSRVLQMVGSWQEGTVMTIILNRSTPMANVLDTFRSIPEIEDVTEHPLTHTVNPKLLKKAEAMPRLKNRTRKTLFVTLEKN
ncbi:response regulator transcription factor [Chloroflexota bacterium]